MAAKWIKSKFPGIRYRLHPSRKHGVGPDKYFTLYYKLDGKPKQEALGWASEGWTEKQASIILAELKKNQATGEGPRTLSEKRAMEDQARKEREDIALKQSVESMSIQEIFEGDYLREQRQINKKPKSIKTERLLFQKWIKPEIGKMTLANVSKADLDRIRTKMLDADLSMRSFLYALSIISQVYNFCIGKEIYQGVNPVTSYKKARKRQLTNDNKKQRFLNYSEAEELLQAIRKKSQTLYGISRVSLYSGMRASEIFRLRWADIDLNNGFILVLDSKTGHSRNVPLHENLKEYFQEIGPGENNELVFKSRKGGMITEVSRTFDRCVHELGLNQGIEDNRQTMTFHSLRHTAASWMVMEGVDLFTVGKILGHTTTRMTERYSHLSPDHLIKAIGRIGQPKTDGKGKVLPLRKSTAS